MGKAECANDIAPRVTPRNFGGGEPARRTIGRGVAFDMIQNRYTGFYNSSFIFDKTLRGCSLVKIEVGLAKNFGRIMRAEIPKVSGVAADKARLAVFEKDGVGDVVHQGLQ